MISGIDVNAVSDYVSKYDKDNPTIWQLGVLPYYIIGRFVSTKPDEQFELAVKIVQVGLKGWKNFGDIQYRQDSINLFGKVEKAVPEDLISKIPVMILAELAEKIVELNKLSEAERKN